MEMAREASEEGSVGLLGLPRAWDAHPVQVHSPLPGRTEFRPHSAISPEGRWLVRPREAWAAHGPGVQEPAAPVAFCSGVLADAAALDLLQEGQTLFSLSGPDSRSLCDPAADTQ